jgi:ADP-heptose:LPS heptosyltransferase
MRVRPKFNALGDELAMTAVIRELKRQRPQEMIRPELHRRELVENNPHVNIGITDEGRFELEVHMNEDIGNIAQSFAKQLGMDPLVDDTPEVFLTPEEIARAEEKLQGIPMPVVAIDTRAMWESRKWAQGNFQRVIDELETISFVEMGSEGGSPSLLNNTRACFVNKCSIRESAAIMSECDLFLGNDSGGFHLAAAVGTPQVVLFGPKKWYARGYWNTTPVYSFEKCAPNCESLCGRRREGPEGKTDNWCLGKIKTMAVEDAIFLALKRFPK